MPYKEMMKDKITLLKPDGRRFENITAQVDPEMIVIDDAKLPLEEGDRIHRHLPNGLTEVYMVLDRGFYSGLGPIPDHYQAKVRKETSLPTRQTMQVIYNLTGPNARININSEDRSLNVVDITPENLFSELRKTLRDAVREDARRQEILYVVDSLEKAKGTPGFVDRYRKFIALAADHMTLLSPFIPALTQMLG
jgi:hypothetical protein